MQTIDIPLGAGELKTFDIGGAYFEFIEGLGAVDINFVDGNGSRAKDLEMLGALPGYWVSGSFSRFEIANRMLVPQTIRVMFGSGTGGSRRIQGAVRVVDEVTEQVLRYGITAPLAITAFLANELIAPGANNKGITLRGATLNNQAGTGGTINSSLVVCKSLPTAFHLPQQQFSFMNLPNFSTTLMQRDINIMNKFVPPGWGLYHVQEIKIAAAAQSNAVVFAEVMT